MSERLTVCPECRSKYVAVIEIHNPETTDMNAQASLKCEDCAHTWEGLVTSPKHREQRNCGWIR